MKKKSIISIICILLIIISLIAVYKLFIEKNVNDNETYITIKCSVSPGATSRYIPTSNYIIYKNGKVEYIPDEHENKKEELKKINKSELKEIYDTIINSSTEPINNEPVSLGGRRKVL